MSAGGGDSRRSEEDGDDGRRRFRLFEATSLMVGAGVGAGIMAVPFLAAKVGLVGLALILPVAWAASALVHLMLAEVLFRTGRDLQVVELMRLYVFRGRTGRPLLWAVFALLSLAFLANLAAYVAGAGEIVADLAGDRPAPRRARRCTSSRRASSSSACGRSASPSGSARSRSWASSRRSSWAGASASRSTPPLGPMGRAPEWLALYGMVMYAYWTFYSVPQVVAGMGGDHRGGRARDPPRARRSTAP